MVRIGDKAPNFELADTEGQRWTERRRALPRR